MRWGGDEVGVVLTRNELWLLLNALTGADLPAVDWEGNRLEPWVVGELRARLQAALRPDPLSDVEERPVIRVDSELGRSLAAAGVRPLVIEDGYDLGSLIAVCGERGWGAEVRLPVGSGPRTPAEAVVRNGEAGEFVGLERPVVALARALLGALDAKGSVGAKPAKEGGSDRAFEEHVIWADSINPGEREETVRKMAGQGWELVVEEGGRLVFRRLA